MFGLNKGGGNAPMGGPPMASPRPMPNPMAGGQPVAPAAPQRQGMFPNMSSQQRYDMAMEMLKSGMQMGANSGSPLAAFLSPLAGAAIGGSITNKYEASKDKEQDAMTAALMPQGMSAKAQELIGIMDNPNTPDYLKALAKDQLTEALKPVGTGGGGGGKRSGGGKGGGGAKPSVNIYGDYEFDGLVYGRTKDDKYIQRIGPDGQPVKAKKPKIPGAPSEDAPLYEEGDYKVYPG